MTSTDWTKLLCEKSYKVFEKSKYEKTFWNNWHEKHSKWQYLKKISKCKDCQINSWQRNSERNNDINEKLEKTKHPNVISSTSLKNSKKKLEFVDQHSTAEYFQYLQKSPYSLSTTTKTWHAGRFVTHRIVNCVASLKRKSIFSTTALLQSTMVDSSGITTQFSRPFCSILPPQTSMCLLPLRDIKVLL